MFLIEKMNADPDPQPCQFNPFFILDPNLEGHLIQIRIRNTGVYVGIQFLPRTDPQEEKDQSKIRNLTDEELVKACGGRTAHK